jgi:transposase
MYLCISKGQADTARAMVQKAKALNVADPELAAQIRKADVGVENLYKRRFKGSWIMVGIWGLCYLVPGLLWYLVNLRPQYKINKDVHDVEEMGKKDYLVGGEVGVYFSALPPGMRWAAYSLPRFVVWFLILLLSPITFFYLLYDNYLSDGGSISLHDLGLSRDKVPVAATVGLGVIVLVAGLSTFLWWSGKKTTSSSRVVKPATSAYQAPTPPPKARQYNSPLPSTKEIPKQEVGPDVPKLPSSALARDPLGRFQVGRKWAIDWQSQFHYRGILQITQQMEGNRYLARITVSFLNNKNKEITVSMDGLLTIQGQNVIIRCSNPSASWWDTDDFYLEWNNDTMTGYNIDKKGRRGTAVFRLVEIATEATSEQQLVRGPQGYFQVGSKWAIDWQSQFQYHGILQIQQQLAANRYLSRITVSYANEKNVKRTVSMDGILTIQGKEVVIRCSNPSVSWWDTDDFYLEWNNNTMTGYNIDKKGRRGTAVFRFVG